MNKPQLLAFLITLYSVHFSILSSERLRENSVYAYKETVVCSNKWSNISARCPKDINNYFESKLRVNDIKNCTTIECDGSSLVLDYEYIVTFLNADTGLANRYKAIKRNNIFVNNVLLREGIVSVKKENSSLIENDAARSLHESYWIYNELNRTMPLVQNNGDLIDANGNKLSHFAEYANNCSTFLDYALNVNSCRGLFNRAVDSHLKNNVVLKRLLNSLSETRLLVSTIIPSFNVEKMRNFTINLSHHDSSRTSIDVEVLGQSISGHETIVGVSTDEHRSRMAGGSTYYQFHSLKVPGQLSSKEEAISFAKGGFPHKQCSEEYLKSNGAAKLSTILSPEGARKIYQINDNYFVYSECNY